MNNAMKTIYIQLICIAVLVVLLLGVRKYKLEQAMGTEVGYPAPSWVTPQSEIITPPVVKPDDVAITPEDVTPPAVTPPPQQRRIVKQPQRCPQPGGGCPQPYGFRR
jgi:hypothetical protein